jgi:zinc transport system substrate-binding protein
MRCTNWDWNMSKKTATGAHVASRQRVYWALLVVLLLSAQPATAQADGSSGHVMTVNYPLAYFTERIAGGAVKVSFPVPAAVDPAFWVPDVATISAYQQADLVILNGAGYAQWTNRVSLPLSRMVNTSASFSTAYLRNVELISHQHGPTAGHQHSGIAFTTWLDLQQALRQAESIFHALERHFPDQQAALAANFEALSTDLLALDAAFATVSTNLQGIPLLASHPVYQYLARRYGLAIKSLLWEPDLMPPDSEFELLATAMASQPRRWMLWEAAPRPDLAARLAGAGIQAVVIAPCANRPVSGDFLTTMQANYKALSMIQQR